MKEAEEGGKSNQKWEMGGVGRKGEGRREIEGEGSGGERWMGREEGR